MPKAELVILDTLCTDIKTLDAELSEVRKTVIEEADRLEKAGELKPTTLSDLKEQKTIVRNVGHIPQYNMMAHKTGRTSMERFTMNADDAVKSALDSTDSVKEKYSKLLEYFGEDEKMPSNDFFGLMKRFIIEFEQAAEQVEKLEKARVSI